MKYNIAKIKENRMNNVEQARDTNEPPVVVKLVIPVDGRNKVIKTIAIIDWGSTTMDVMENASLELEVFKAENPHLRHTVKAEVTFKMVV